MRIACAVGMALLFLSVIAVCPLVACPLQPDRAASQKACCHRSHSRSTPCSEPSAQNCPYIVLERGKVAPILSQAAVVGLVPTSPDAYGPAFRAAFVAHPRLVNSTGLFLRIRVLLV